MSDHILRIFSEAIANITRHAQANEVEMNMAIRNNQLMLEIRDDGKGFDPEAAGRAGHYGLLGMRERARLIEGTLTIESGPGSGARIKLVAPVLQGEIS